MKKFDLSEKIKSGNISIFIQLAEMVRIIGFHIPNTCDKWRQFLVKKFDLNEKTKSGNYQPFTYHWSLYTRLLIQVSISIKLDIAHIQNNLKLRNECVYLFH